MKTKINYSCTIRVFACYADTTNLSKIASLCIAANLRFTAYSDEYFIFEFDPTGFLEKNDPNLEFRVDEERWLQFGGDILGFKILEQSVRIDDLYIRDENNETKIDIMNPKNNLTDEMTKKIANLVVKSMKCGMAQQLVKEGEAKFIEAFGTEGHSKENAAAMAKMTVAMVFAAIHWDELVKAAKAQ